MMQDHARVKLYLGDGLTERAGPVRADFRRRISDPMRSLSSGMSLIGSIDENLGGVIGRTLL